MHHLFLITSPPNIEHQTKTIELVNSIIKNKETIDAVFFYSDGVLYAEPEYSRLWRNFSLQNNIALHLCKTSALNRNIIKDENSMEITSPFVISSLAIFFEILQNNAKLHQF